MRLAISGGKTLGDFAGSFQAKFVQQQKTTESLVQMVRAVHRQCSPSPRANLGSQEVSCAREKKQ